MPRLRLIKSLQISSLLQGKLVEQLFAKALRTAFN